MSQQLRCSLDLEVRMLVFATASPSEGTSLACIVEVFHNLTCTCTRLFTMECSHEPYHALPSQSKLVSLSHPGGMEGRVGLGTTTMSKQFVQDLYVTAISC